MIEDCFYICVLDFEATCWNDKAVARKEMEIIEFPSQLYKVNKKTNESEFIAEFAKYVRPVIHPTLSKFCTELTGITQSQVDSADPLEIVYAQHLEWIQHHVPSNTRIIIATCGNWDLNTQLRHEASRKGLMLHSYHKQFINVKKEYESKYQRKAFGMTSMLEELNLSLDGRHHAGMDDTRNIAKIVLKLLEDGHGLENFTIIAVK